VDRYKQLLLKQRDIMIALTTRLNERDETIVALQEELDSFVRYQREQEDKTDALRAKCAAMEKILSEYDISMEDLAHWKKESDDQVQVLDSINNFKKNNSDPVNNELKSIKDDFINIKKERDNIQFKLKDTKKESSKTINDIFKTIN